MCVWKQQHLLTSEVRRMERGNLPWQVQSWAENSRDTAPQTSPSSVYGSTACHSSHSTSWSGGHSTPSTCGWEKHFTSARNEERSVDIRILPAETISSVEQAVSRWFRGVTAKHECIISKTCWQSQRLVLDFWDSHHSNNGESERWHADRTNKQ